MYNRLLLLTSFIELNIKTTCFLLLLLPGSRICALLFRSPQQYYNKSACWFVVVVVKGAFTTQNYLVLKTVVVCKYVHINLLYCIITCILRAFYSLCVSLCVHFKYKRLNLCSVVFVYGVEKFILIENNNKCQYEVDKITHQM